MSIGELTIVMRYTSEIWLRKITDWNFVTEIQKRYPQGLAVTTKKPRNGLTIKITLKQGLNNLKLNKV